MNAENVENVCGYLEERREINMVVEEPAIYGIIEK